MRSHKIEWTSVGRDEVTPAHAESADLVVAIGGDGTTLMSAMAIRGTTPLLGINSDPTIPGQAAQRYRSRRKEDERRSTGHLCACSAATMEAYLERIVSGVTGPTALARIRTEARTPPKRRCSDPRRIAFDMRPLRPSET